jgi:TonB family protein
MKVLSGLAIVLCTWWAWPGARQTIAQSKVSVGSVALLAEPKGIADLRALQEAIGDPDPAVRAVAARVAGLLDRKDLASPLLELLGREQDTLAAREHVRALLYLRGMEIWPQARAAAARLGEPVGSILAEWLARNQPEQFATAMPELLRDIPESDSAMFGRIAAMSIWQTPSSRNRVTTAFAGAGSRRAWRGFLDYLGPDVDAGIVKVGLTSANAAVREATIWFVVSEPTARRPAATINLAPVLKAEGAVPLADDTEWAAFGRELIARRLGKSGPADGSAAIRRHGLENLVDTRTLAALPELTAAERSALQEIVPELPATPPVAAKRVPDSLVEEKKRAGAATRTFPSIAPGLLGSLLTSVGCTPSSDLSVFGAAKMSFHRDGRPRGIGLDTTRLPAACVPFLRFLAMLTVAPPDEPILDGESQWLLTSMAKGDLACADEDVRTPSGSRRTERVGGKIKTPRKTSDLKPVYPEAMVQARVAGVVVLEGTISSTGCVVDARVLRSIQTPLDVAALRAVLGWRFAPTLLDGKPVPVVMTVTVNFTLQ